MLMDYLLSLFSIFTKICYLYLFFSNNKYKFLVILFAIKKHEQDINR